MANDNSTTQCDTRPFRWYPESISDFPHTKTLDSIKSLSGGVVCILGLLEMDGLAREDSGLNLQPFLSVTQRGDMLRMAIEAARIIEMKSERAMGWSIDHGWDRVRFLAAKNHASAGGTST